MGALASFGNNRRMTRVWDPLVRIGHWTLVAGFAGAFLTEEGGIAHQSAGYVVAAAVALRVAWGFVGPRQARFAGFVPGPRRFLAHLRDLGRGRERRYLGHNPAAGAMIVVLLGLMAVLAVSGWLQTTVRCFGAEWLESLHGTAANVALALVCVHVAGAIYESIRHRENLPWAMVTGRKRA